MITSAPDLAASISLERKQGMVTPNPHVHGIRPSSVVPKHVSGGSTHELTGLDLAMRLHYIKAVYFFDKDHVDGITIYDLKKALFLLLDSYFPVAGRIRCLDSEEDSVGKQQLADDHDDHDHQKRRYYIKCNDGGVRIIEAKCDKTVKEWIEMDEEADHVVSNDEGLVPNVIIGPKVDFTPLMLLQLTTFSCGGLAIGLSCNHVLGDVFTISIFMNTYSDLLAGNSPKLPVPNQWKPKRHDDDLPCRAPCTYLKPASTIGDAWLIDAGKPMKQFRLHISETSLANLKSKVGKRFSPFGLISAVVWKAAAEIRGRHERVTVVRKCCGTDDGRWILGNRHQIASSVALGDVASADLSELARVIMEVKADEDSREDMAWMMEMDGFPDVMMYGGDLTFVDLDGVKCGDFKMNQRGPQFVNLFYSSVGGEGVVTVLPGLEHDKGGRVVCVCMCVDEIDAVRRVVMEGLSMCA